MVDPYLFHPGGAIPYAFVQRALSAIIAQASTDMGALAINAAKTGTRGSLNGVRITAQAIGTEFGNPEDLVSIHQKAAAKARSAVIRSFGAQHATATGPYRVGQGRISNGALRAAFDDPEFARATATGVAFVNQGEMDRKVVHWRRMNFGALGSAIKGPTRTDDTHELRIDNRIVGRLRIDTPPRPAFRLPPGRFQKGTDPSSRVPHLAERRGMDLFYPGGGGRQINLPTRGIKPKNFIDAGVKVLARELSIGYTNQIDVWLARAEAKVKLPAKVTVGTGRFLPGGGRG